MFPLFESIRIEKGKAQLVALHQERMEKSLQLLGKKLEFSLINCVEKQSFDINKIYKLRLSYNEKDYSIDISEYKQRKIEQLQILEDNDIDHSLKYSNRTAINKLMMKRGSADDIIIVKNNEITDTSFSNLIFFDGKTWHTPKNPLLKGVMRKHLLENGIIHEEIIHSEETSAFESFMLINAMLPFDLERKLPISAIIEMQ
jgi:4-amino-4-deoxychorismate lyase